MQFMVKSVKMMYYSESCTLWVIHIFHKLVIDYGYWQDLLTFLWKFQEHFVYQINSCFILLQNIVDIIINNNNKFNLYSAIS